MKALITPALALCLAGCAVGPNYRRPFVSTSPQWTAPQTRGTGPGVEPQTDLWWKSFHDVELDSLIERAVEANYDLQLATARVEEARAATGFARAGYSPQLSAGADVGRYRRLGVSGPEQKPFSYEANAYNLDAGLSWEVDL